MLWFVAKEIVIGVAQIAWAVMSSLVTIIVMYPATGVMWLLTRMGLWNMPRR